VGEAEDERTEHQRRHAAAHEVDPARLEAARLEFDVQAQRFEEARERLEAITERRSKGPSQQERLHGSEFARLQARLGTMPVIEQAKGILMAQQQCGPAEAFDLLRRASQRANVNVSVLAARIVEQTAAPRWVMTPIAPPRRDQRDLAAPIRLWAGQTEPTVRHRALRPAQWLAAVSRLASRAAFVRVHRPVAVYHATAIPS
jgi:hypothetical protein